MFKSKEILTIYFLLAFGVSESYNISKEKLQFYVKDIESMTKNQKGVILKDIFDWTTTYIINSAGKTNKIYLELGGGSAHITQQIASLRKQKIDSLDLEKKLYFNDLSELHIQEAKERIPSELSKQIIFLPGHMEKVINSLSNRGLNNKVSYCLARRTLHFVEGKQWPIIFSICL